ncbi:MAG: cyclase, partial [Archangium sp.]|nr:cyclase [Archangium sp.]
VPVSDGVIDAALTQGRALAVANVRDDARFSKRDSVLLYGVHQVLCVPIGHQAPFDGVLYLNRTTVSEEPPERLLQVSAAMAQVVLAGILKFRAAAPDTNGLRRLLHRFYSAPVVERRLTDLKTGKLPLSHVAPCQATVLHLGLDTSGGAMAKLPAERAADVVGLFHRLASEVVFNFEGTVDVLTADAVRTLFGAPYAAGDDAARALRAALRFKAEWAKAMNQRPVRERLAVCAGLATGPLRAGLVGTDASLTSVAFGEPVQRALGVLHLAEAGQVLVAGEDSAGLGGTFGIAPVGERVLPGGREKVPLFEVLGELRPA